MPSRMLRDITDSEAYNAVDVHCRDTFIRLMNKVDDFGCIEAGKALRGVLYPLLLNEIREADLERWLNSLASIKLDDERSAVLIRFYDAKGKRYLQIARFKQRMRRKTLAHPMPPWGKIHPDDGEDPPPIDDGHLSDTRLTDDRHTSAEEKRREEKRSNTARAQLAGVKTLREQMAERRKT